MRKMLGYTAVAALFWTASANASTISITLSETGFAPLTVSASSFIGSYGTYSNVGVQAFGPFSPDLLNSNILTKQGSGTGTLTITVNETGLIHPVSELISSFSNLNQGTDRMRTSLNSSLLASANLTGLSTAGPFTDSVVTGSPFALHEQYQVNAAPNRLNNSAIDIQATPLPGALGLFTGGLGLLGFWSFKRTRKTAADSLKIAA